MHHIPRPDPDRPTLAEIQRRIEVLFRDSDGRLTPGEHEVYRGLLEQYLDARQGGARGREGEDEEAAA